VLLCSGVALDDANGVNGGRDNDRVVDDNGDVNFHDDDDGWSTGLQHVGQHDLLGDPSHLV